MLKLSKRVDYALIALMHLAQQDEGASSAREVATIYGMPQDLLAKVLQKLTRSGLVVSRQGVKGGYSLARPPEAITVARVIEVVEGQPSLTQCLTDLGACEQFDTCNIKSPLQRLNDEVLLMLSRTTIARMCDEDHASFAGERTNERRRRGRRPAPCDPGLELRGNDQDEHHNRQAQRIRRQGLCLRLRH